MLISEANKIPHNHERLIGQWGVGLNHTIGKITGWDGDKYTGHTLRDEPWWTRIPTVLTWADQQILEATYATISGGSGS